MVDKSKPRARVTLFRASGGSSKSTTSSVDEAALLALPPTRRVCCIVAPVSPWSWSTWPYHNSPIFDLHACWPASPVPNLHRESIRTSGVAQSLFAVPSSDTAHTIIVCMCDKKSNGVFGPTLFVGLTLLAAREVEACNREMTLFTEAAALSTAGYQRVLDQSRVTRRT